MLVSCGACSFVNRRVSILLIHCSKAAASTGSAAAATTMSRTMLKPVMRGSSTSVVYVSMLATRHHAKWCVLLLQLRGLRLA
jgi:hypothetical protein